MSVYKANLLARCADRRAAATFYQLAGVLPQRALVVHGVPMRDANRSRTAERRWIVLSEDGRYVTLGRASDPTEQDILEAEAALIRNGLGGWLAVMQGNPYADTNPQLLEVRCLGKPTVQFQQAAEACVAAIMRRRQESDSR